MRPLSDFLKTSHVVVLFITCLLAITGCHTGTIGKPHLVTDLMGSSPTPDLNNLASGSTPPLVVVKYIAHIDPMAHKVFRHHWHSLHIHNSYPKRFNTFEVTRGVPMETQIKTSYFAMELASTLRKVFPENHVLLHPLKVVPDETPPGFRLVSFAETPPADLTVHFSISHNLFRLKYPSRGDLLDTFANQVTPAIYIEVSGASDRGFPLQFPAGTFAAFDQTGQLQKNYSGILATWNVINNATNHEVSANKPSWYTDELLERPFEPSATYKAFPDTFIVTADQVIYGYGAYGTGWQVEDSPFYDYWRYIASSVADIASWLQAADPKWLAEHYLPLLELKASTVDPELASVLSRMRKAEAVFGFQQDTAYLNAMFNGAWGTSIRQLIQGEAQYRKSSSAQNLMVTTSLFSNAAGAFSSLYATQAGTLSPQQNLNNQMLNMQTVTSTLTSSSNTQKSLFDVYSRNFSPVQADASNLSIKISDQEFTIQANSLEDIRTKFRDLLLRMFPDKIEEGRAVQ